MKEELISLGFFISPEGLKMDPKTLKEILEWHVPKSTFEGHTFHGLAIFY